MLPTRACATLSSVSVCRWSWTWSDPSLVVSAKMFRKLISPTGLSAITRANSAPVLLKNNRLFSSKLTPGGGPPKILITGKKMDNESCGHVWTKFLWQISHQVDSANWASSVQSSCGRTSARRTSFSRILSNRMRSWPAVDRTFSRISLTLKWVVEIQWDISKSNLGIISGTPKNRCEPPGRLDHPLFRPPQCNWWTERSFGS